MSEMDRREAIRILAAAPFAVGLPWTPEDVSRAARDARDALHAAAAGQAFQPRFFSPHEWETVRVLVDLIIPRDERSGGATDAGVPEFMDFMMTDRPEWQTEMRGGLAWVDDQCLARFGKTFVECAGSERTALLDDIAWPDRAAAEMTHGVAFFNGFRDLTASGFWSSRMGVEDLQYMGNVPLPEWRGCPDAQLRKLDVRYDE